MDEVFHLLEEYSTIRNVVLLVGLLCLLRVSVWIIRSLWSGIKAFILSGLFRVKLNSSSYGWAGKELSLVACYVYCMFIAVVTGASDGIGKEYAIQARRAVYIFFLHSQPGDMFLPVGCKR